MRFAIWCTPKNGLENGVWSHLEVRPAIIIYESLHNAEVEAKHYAIQCKTWNYEAREYLGEKQ